MQLDNPCLNAHLKDMANQIKTVFSLGRILISIAYHAMLFVVDFDFPDVPSIHRLLVTEELAVKDADS